MKRSEINRIMREALAFLDEHKFILPPFATWTPEDWRGKGEECRGIVEQQLGWDITDFGSGDFAQAGLFLFTALLVVWSIMIAAPLEKPTTTTQTPNPSKTP